MNKTSDLLILAGGFGTRLRSAVSDVPKPLAPVCGKPFLQYLIENWVANGISKLTFLLYHQADKIEVFLEQQKLEGCLNNCQVRTIKEPVAMGTGGAVAFAVKQLRLAENFLVANADTWAGEHLDRMLQAPAPAIAVVTVENTARYGSVQVLNDKVVLFEEKQQSSGFGWINAGLYNLEPGLFTGWDEQPFSLEQIVLPKLAASGSLLAVPLETDFIDIGIPEDYFRFCRWIESGKERLL